MTYNITCDYSIDKECERLFARWSSNNADLDIEAIIPIGACCSYIHQLALTGHAGMVKLCEIISS